MTDKTPWIDNCERYCPVRNRKLRIENLERRQLLAVTIEPAGDALPVNTTTEDYQEQSAVAVEPDGDFVVAWSSWGQDGSQGGIYAQRFQSDGTKLGGEIPVNNVTDGNQGYPDIAVDPTSGAFVVTWQNDAAGASDVYARAFHSDGSPVGDQVLINAAEYDHYNPAIASVESGEFLIAWDSFDSQAGSLLHARHFLATNATQGDEFAPATGTQEMNADVAGSGDGSFVITWQSADADGSGIASRVYDPHSAPVDLPWTVNNVTDGDQTYPKVAVAPDGTFAVTWLSDASGSTEVVAQRYQADGSAQGDPLYVNADATVQPYDPSIAALSDGSLYLAWTDTNLDVLSRAYDSSGTAAGLPEPITTTDGSQLAPHVAAAEGHLVATWTGEDADSDGVFGQIYTVSSMPPTANAGGPYQVAEAAPLTLDASASTTPQGTTITDYAWDFDADRQYDDANGVNPTFTRTADGSYTVGLLVTNSAGLTQSAETTVTVTNVAPTAHPGGPYTAPEGGTIQLTASASTDPGSDIADYHWDLDNDGQHDDATGVQPTFSAADLDGPTTVTVGLKVIDDDGAADTSTVQVAVTNVAPTADAAGPYSILDGGTTLLSAATSTDPGDDITSYRWDLDGDGTYDTNGKAVTFSSDQVGTHEVTLLVTDIDGASDTATAQVTVSHAAPTDLGTITFNQIEGVYPATGNRWYQVTTGRAGFLTVLAKPASGSASVDLYSTDRTEPTLASSTGTGGEQRLDHVVDVDETYLVRVSGTSSDVDLTLVNLVNHEETAVAVMGTDQDDTFQFVADEQHTVTINGVPYEFPKAECTLIGFDGTEGHDTAELTGSPETEIARFHPDSGTFGENGYFVVVDGVTEITAHAGGGQDAAFMYDSLGDDEFYTRKGYGKLSGDGYVLETFDFMFNYGYAMTVDGGTDIARMEDTPGADKFKLDWPQPGKFFGKMYGGGQYYNRAKNFEQIEAVMTDGKNTVRFFDSEGDDTFFGQRDESRMTGAGFDVTVSGYDSLIAYASKGTDVARLEDSDDNDTVRARSHKVILWGGSYRDPNYKITARKFDEYHIERKHGGADKAKLHDTVLDDHVDAAGNAAKLYINRDGNLDLLYETIAFEWVKLYGTPDSGQVTNHNTLKKTEPLDYNLIYDPALWEELP